MCMHVDEARMDVCLTIKTAGKHSECSVALTSVNTTHLKHHIDKKAQ